MAADESCREREDGSQCSRHWGVLVGFYSILLVGCCFFWCPHKIIHQNSMIYKRTYLCFLRMDFKDFCRYFTDVVVCRLVERNLLWPSSHWKEVRHYGEWAPAPASLGSPPPTTVLHNNHTLSLGRNNVKPGGTKQRGNRKEARLGESQQRGGRRCEQNKAVKKATKEDEGGEVGGWEAQMDKRSRCGGCINHRDTFLHNPQVTLKWKVFQLVQDF